MDDYIPQPSALNTEPPSPNPGFLLMTRPASASKITNQNKSFGTMRNNQSMEFPPFRMNMSDANFEYNGSSPRGYNNKYYNAYSSPRQNFTNHRFSSNRYNDHSTPKPYYQGSRFSNSSSYNKFKSNASQNSFTKAPLKEISIEKFASIKMIEDPWQELEK